MEVIERYRGALLGLACGDVLGTTLEFKSPGTFKPVTDIVGGGPFRLKPGEWTDDTSMALCLSESLIKCKGFDPVDQIKKFLRWYREGQLSSIARCFDIGNTTRDALVRFERTGEPHSGSTDKHSAGNGSIMRLAPVPLFFAADPQEAIVKPGESSRTRHGNIFCAHACRYFGALIAAAVSGASKEELLSTMIAPVSICWEQRPLVPEIAAIAGASFKKQNPPTIKGTGYVVQSLGPPC
jgi:ADP-ribosyl-[dinitrogen reductase] hydrolase